MDPAHASFEVIDGSSGAVFEAIIAVNGRYGLGDDFNSDGLKFKKKALINKNLIQTGIAKEMTYWAKMSADLPLISFPIKISGNSSLVIVSMV